MAEASVEYANHHAVVTERRGLDIALVLGVAKPLGRGLFERHSGADHPQQRAALGLGEDAPQLSLGEALRPVTHRGPSAARPRRPEHPLDLAAVGQTVLDVPSRAACPLHTEHVTGHRPRTGEMHCHRLKGLFAPTILRAWDRAQRAKPCPEPCPELATYRGI